MTMEEWAFVRSYALVMRLKVQDVLEHAEKYGISDLLINAESLASSEEQQERYKALQHLVATAPTFTIDREESSSPDNAAKLAYAYLGKHAHKEQFLLLSLDTRNRLICIDTISQGSLSSAVIHAHDLFRVAIANNASSVILCHNHPSGDPQPSQADIQATERLVKGAALLGISILDHIILGDSGRYYSFKENGLMPYRAPGTVFDMAR